LKNKILIIGFGESGKWAYNLSIKNGYMPLIYDDKFMDIESILPVVKHLEFAVISPVINRNHPLVKVLDSNGVQIISEIEFAYYFRNLNSKIIGVTGTNGKTTVVRQLESIFGNSCVVGGNIGVPYSKIVNSTKETVVLELSSFQLDRIINFKPDVSVITNLAPDHIDYHGSFDDYINAKLNILKNCNSKNKIIYFGEDELLCSKIKEKTEGDFYYFAFNKKAGNGIYLKNGQVVVCEHGKEKILFSLSDVGQMSKHNILNMLASTMTANLLGVGAEQIISGLKSFSPSPYRQQVVKNNLGITIINDSKSTNLASTLTAIENYKDKNVCLIVGGKPKNEDYSKLFSHEFRVDKIIAYGEAKNEFKDCAYKCGYKKIVLAETLKESVEIAFNNLRHGDVLLFSPACSSFDQFSSYEERGRVFDELIRKHKKLF